MRPYAPTMDDYLDDTDTDAAASPRPENGRLVDPSATSGDRVYALCIHLSLLLAFAPVFPALIMWLIRKDESGFVDDHGREAVNFQISLVIYYVVAGLLSTVCIGFALIPAIYVLGLVGMIAAARAANRGEYYRYPMCIRLLNP